jgi:hypothetical protein
MPRDHRIAWSYVYLLVDGRLGLVSWPARFIGGATVVDLPARLVAWLSAPLAVVPPWCSRRSSAGLLSPRHHRQLLRDRRWRWPKSSAFIIALRDLAGGNLGITKAAAGDPGRWTPVRRQAGLVLRRPRRLVIGLAVWRHVDHSIGWRAATIAERGAAASIGINVSRRKMAITLLSAGHRFGGVLCALPLHRRTISGLTLSLQIVFGVIAAAWQWCSAPPSARCCCWRCPRACLALGAISRNISLIYGTLLVLFIIYLPGLARNAALGRAERRRITLSP